MALQFHSRSEPMLPDDQREPDGSWRPDRPPSMLQRLVPRWLRRFVRATCILVLIGLLGIGAFALSYFVRASRFDLSELSRAPSAPVFLDQSGAVLSATGTSSVPPATRSDLPDFLVLSLQAREDARFFEHHGIDVRGLVRATVRNIKDRSFTQGASTLTMQLARNAFPLSSGDKWHQELDRKFLEMALTLRIERHMGKDAILTNYLNRIYFGAGAYGISQAASTYFGKPVTALTDGECAIIVGIIRGPHIYSPLRNPQAALEQRRQTLARLVTMGKISPARCDRIASQPLRLAPPSKNTSSPRSQVSYALRAAQRELDLILDRLPTDQPPGRLTVRTTLNAAWQARLEDQLKQAVHTLESEPGWNHPTPDEHIPGSATIGYLQFAAITLETRTGGILALLGGRDYGDSAVDRTHSCRDLGPAFEPIIAAAAAERGKPISPGNPVLTGRRLGRPAEVERIARRCGLDGPFLDTEDLYRGAVAATPQEMATALATLGNSGQRPEPHLISEVRDPSGKLLYQAKPAFTQAITPASSRAAITTLARVGSTHTYAGATASERDAWALRLGPSGATAVWLGFDQPAKITSEARLSALLSECLRRLGNTW